MDVLRKETLWKNKLVYVMLTIINEFAIGRISVMMDVQQRAAAKEFAAYWAGRGDEKQETQRFWIDLLRNVYGVAEPEKAIEFEVPVKLDHVSFIDGYIGETRVLIE